MDHIEWFHNCLLGSSPSSPCSCWRCLIVVMVKFNAKANPVPSKTTHNTLIEVAWTLIPVIILVVIAVPSFRLLFQELDIPKADLTIKATGKQWYWTYAYPDNGKFGFDSLLACDESRPRRPPRLLGVDNEMVVPVNKMVRVETTGADVIHSFAVPAFGIKIDAMPGRLNETWFKATKIGMYLRPVLRTVRQGPRLYADRGARRSDQEFAPGSRPRRRSLRPFRRTRIASRRTRRSKHRSFCDGTRQGRRDRKVQDRDARTGFENGNDRSDTRRSRPRRSRARRAPIRPAGGASSIRRTTRTSARCT